HYAHSFEPVQRPRPRGCAAGRNHPMSPLKPGLSGDLALWGKDPAAPVMGGSVAAMLRKRGREDGERTALTWRSGEGLARMSYAELLAAAERAARWILGHAAPGDRVAVWARNGWEWVVVEHACALSGTVITPWNTAWTDHEARHAIALTDPRII